MKNMTFDEWYSMHKHQLSNEPVCRVIWEAAQREERVAAELRCAKTPVLVDGHHEYTALKVQAMMMEAVRSNAELTGRQRPAQEG